MSFKYADHIYFGGRKTRKPEGDTIMPKSYAKVPYTMFADAASELKMSEAKLIEAIGYNRNSRCNWKNAGLIPKVASVAIEGILHRKSVSNKEHGTLVVKTNNGNLDAVKSVLSALDCSFVEV
jgi:hypothetical protein